MKSFTKITLIVSFPILLAYGSFVGLWTPAGLEGYTAEQLGADFGACESCVALPFPVSPQRD